jgi:hypothetical protein
MSRVKMSLAAGAAVLALGGAMVTPAPAEAGARTGTWRNGMVAGPYGVGYYGRPAYRSYGYGYRPAYYGRRSNVGGAVAAGVIGGLALGALASRPAYAYPAYSYPAYSYPAYPVAAPGYYGDVGYAPSCYTVRRQFVDAWGRVFVRRTQVCE